MTGTVLHFGRKGFGYIECDDTQRSIYFHITDVPGLAVLHQGERVRFTITQAAKGPRAVNVTRITPAATLGVSNDHTSV